MPCTHLCVVPCTQLPACSATARLTLCHALQSFEALNARAVAVVVDPIQSVKGKVVIDAFRWAAGKMCLACCPSFALQSQSSCGRFLPSRQVVFDALRWAVLPATLTSFVAQNPLF